MKKTKEWVAQVEFSLSITFVFMPEGASQVKKYVFIKLQDTVISAVTKDKFNVSKSVC